MLNDKISVFESFDSVPVVIGLSRWIRSCMNPYCSFAKQVKQYRQTGEQHLKKSLPLATVGAVCKGGRKCSNVVSKTGWIALDIDAKDNPRINNAEMLRNRIGQIIYVAFAGLSVSGNGVWALVKVSDSQKQAEYFEQLQTDFKSRGVVLDSTKGKNPNDARFYSFDSNAYITDQFKIYDRLPKPKSQPKPTQFNPTNTGYDSRAKVEQLISKINTDITAGYQNWRNLGFALEDEFGESGREYFHAISQYHSEYDRQECDRQYTQCLEHRGSGISIGTFFHLCREHGIELKRERAGHAPPKEKPLESKYESQKNGNNSKNEYPAEWDNIQVKRETQAYKQATRVAIQDCDTNIERLQIKNPIVGKLSTLFDGRVPEKNGA